MNDIEKFNRYYYDKMNDLEKQNFEEKLKTSGEVNQDFQSHKVLINHIQLLFREEKIESKIERFVLYQEQEQKNLFKGYLAKKLSKEQRKEFEERLESESLFSYEFAKYKNNFKSKETPTISIFSKKRGFIALLVAASIFICFAVNKNIISMQSSISGQELFARYEQTPNSQFVKRSVKSSSNPSELHMVDFTAFDTGQYYDAVENLTQYTELKEIKNTKDSYQLKIYIGYCYLKLGKHDLAIQNLLEAVNNLDNRHRRYALSYLTLAYLKNEDISSAKIYLKELTVLRKDRHDIFNPLNILNQLP